MNGSTRALLLVAALLVIPPTARAQTRLSADDQAEIHDLYAHYNLVLDAGDAEAWAATFVPDGRFGNSVGHDALVTFATNFHASNPGSRHWNTNILVTPTADGAHGTCYLTLWNVSVRPPTITVTGIYQDELVKTPNGWRFKSRVVTTDRPASQ
jgi:actinorhodin biosynthesis protein ActVIA